MSKEKWYEFSEPLNGVPIIYAKENLKKFIDKYSLKGKINPIKDFSHLEFILKNEEETLASFEFESHALMFNHLFYKGKGFIEPNPKE